MGLHQCKTKFAWCKRLLADFCSWALIPLAPSLTTFGNYHFRALSQNFSDCKYRVCRGLCFLRGSSENLAATSERKTSWRHPNGYQNKRVPKRQVFKTQKTCHLDTQSVLIPLGRCILEAPKRVPEHTGTKTSGFQKSRTCHFDAPSVLIHLWVC